MMNIPGISAAAIATIKNSTGSATSERFITYLKDILIPTLRPGDIVIMDNMRSYHVEAVGKLLHKNGVIPRYLPPHNPDLSLIEMILSNETGVDCLTPWIDKASGYVIMCTKKEKTPYV